MKEHCQADGHNEAENEADAKPWSAAGGSPSPKPFAFLQAMPKSSRENQSPPSTKAETVTAKMANTFRS
jgi:hypothetical protein